MSLAYKWPIQGCGCPELSLHNRCMIYATILNARSNDGHLWPLPTSWSSGFNLALAQHSSIFWKCVLRQQVVFWKHIGAFAFFTIRATTTAYNMLDINVIKAKALGLIQKKVPITVKFGLYYYKWKGPILLSKHYLRVGHIYSQKMDKCLALCQIHNTKRFAMAINSHQCFGHWESIYKLDNG